MYRAFTIGILLTLFVSIPGLNEKVQAEASAEEIEIYDAADLDNIRNDLSGHYILMNDIDLEGTEWKPIGKCEDGTSDYRNPCEITDERFSGIFDGQGYEITNLSITTYRIEKLVYFRLQLRKARAKM